MSIKRIIIACKRLFCEHSYKFSEVSVVNDCFINNCDHITLTLQCKDCGKIKNIYYTEEDEKWLRRVYTQRQRE